MTDEKLEKILQQTLIPEVADEDIYTKHEKTNASTRGRATERG